INRGKLEENFSVLAPPGRGLKPPKKAPPRRKARDHQHAEAEHRTGADQHVPKSDDEIPCPPQERRARTRLVEHAHRRPPGFARLSIVSISTKSLLTGGLIMFCGT